MLFRNTEGKEFSMDEVLESMYLFIDEDKDHEYKVIVGSDSQRHGNKTIYISAIVIHRVGKFGPVFYTKEILPHKNHIDLSVRLLKETEMTVEILQKMENSIILDKIGQNNLIAHVDVNCDEQYGSTKMLASCVGWIESFGYECVHKPDAFVASHCADRFTKDGKKLRRSQKRKFRRLNKI